MADKKSSTSIKPLARKKEKRVEKKEVKKPESVPMEGETPNGNEEAPPAEGATASAAADAKANGTAATGENGEEKFELLELPPFEIIAGDRIDPFFFKFQFKNVEYSSGRNKTFLCYLVDTGRGGEGMQRGYLEDEHAGAHAEEAFFLQTLPEPEPELRYVVTWYVSSSPCASCASKLVDVLAKRTGLRLTVFAARLLDWEEPEVRAGLQALAGAGCKLRVMKPLDFSYVWDTFVDGEEERFVPWEDCQENYEYYQEKLAEILQ